MIETLRKIIEAGNHSYQVKLGVNNDTDSDGSSDCIVIHGANMVLEITINIPATMLILRQYFLFYFLKFYGLMTFVKNKVFFEMIFIYFFRQR